MTNRVSYLRHQFKKNPILWLDESLVAFCASNQRMGFFFKLAPQIQVKFKPVLLNYNFHCEVSVAVRAKFDLYLYLYLSLLVFFNSLQHTPFLGLTLLNRFPLRAENYFSKDLGGSILIWKIPNCFLAF